MSLAREAQQEAAATDDTGLQAQALFTLSGIHRWCAHHDSALVIADRGIALTQPLDDPCLRAEGLLLRCAIISTGPDTVTGEMDSVRTAVARCGTPVAHAHLALLEARLALRAGKLDKAENLLARQSDPALGGDLQEQMEQEKLFLTAHALASEGRLREAVAAAEEVLRADRRANRRPAIADDLWALARLHLDAGDTRAARKAAERALSVLTAMSPPEITVTKRKSISAWLAALPNPRT